MGVYMQCVCMQLLSTISNSKIHVKSGFPVKLHCRPQSPTVPLSQLGLVHKEQLALGTHDWIG